VRGDVQSHFDAEFDGECNERLKTLDAGAEPPEPPKNAAAVEFCDIFWRHVTRESCCHQCFEPTRCICGCEDVRNRILDRHAADLTSKRAPRRARYFSVKATMESHFLTEYFNAVRDIKNKRSVSGSGNPHPIPTDRVRAVAMID